MGWNATSKVFGTGGWAAEHRGEDVGMLKLNLTA